MHRKKQPHWTIFLVLLGMILAACGRSLSDSIPKQGATQLPDLGEPTADTTDPDLYERFDISEDLYVRKVQAGVFVITHSAPWPGNSMIVEMRNSELVLVDTPSGLYGSVWIESTNEVPVVATVNYAGTGSGDVHATYNGSQP